MTKKPAEPIWEVWSWDGRTLLCSHQMKLTEREARNKVENDRRIGYYSEARPYRGSLVEAEPQEQP